MDWLFPYVILAFAILLVVIGVQFGRRMLRRRRKTRHEDVLKQVCTAREEGRSPTISEIGGRLGLSLSMMLKLTEDMEAGGLLHAKAGVLEPTEKGERIGLEILRRHRLYERYLRDEAHQPLQRLHGLAERAEHRLEREEIDALSAHLGHPQLDPHGDVIPTASGEIAQQDRTPLTDWPCDRPAVVVHVEDEPGAALTQALAAGLYPGTVLRILAKDDAEITVDAGAGPRAVPPAVAAQVDVGEVLGAEEPRAAPATLADLRIGDGATILGLKPGCSGLMRRRLLDLGFTPGAGIVAVLSNVADEAHAYRLRDTLIALREEQAEQVLIGAIGPDAGLGEPAREASP